MCVLQDGLVSASWADQPSANYHIHLFLRKSPVSPFSTEDKLITGSCVCVCNTNQDPPVLQVLYFVLRMNWLLWPLVSPLSTVHYPPSAKNYLSPFHCPLSFPSAKTYLFPFSAHLVPLCPPLCPEDELIAPQLPNMHWCAVTSLSQVSDSPFSAHVAQSLVPPLSTLSSVPVWPQGGLIAPAPWCTSPHPPHCTLVQIISSSRAHPGTKCIYRRHHHPKCTLWPNPPPLAHLLPSTSRILIKYTFLSNQEQKWMNRNCYLETYLWT